MLKQYLKIDENGFVVEPVLIEEEEEVPADCVEPYGPEKVFYKPKWDGNKWVESMTQEEIDELGNNQPQITLEELKKENELNSLAILELTRLLLGG